MKREIIIPDIAENVETGVISNVLVAEGDDVDYEQPLVEVETDKATTDIPSPFKGKILEIKITQGEEVKVNQVIMLIEVTDGEEKSEEEIKNKTKQNIEEKTIKTEEKEEQKNEDEITGEEKRELERNEVAEEKHESGYNEKEINDNKNKKASFSSSDIPASPSVRRLARESDIRLEDVKGTGPGKRITIDDIKKHISDLQKPDKPEKESPELKNIPDFTKLGEIEKKQFSRIRKLTADNTSYAWNTIPHVTQFEKVDITRLEEFRKNNSKLVEKEGGKLTVTAILVKICALALEKFPVFNSSPDMQNEEIILKKFINIGLAVDTERGLLVPVINDVNKKSLIKVAVEINELAEKARNKKITASEMQGGTFTVSNLGGIGGTNFTPIVNTDQVAILGISKAQIEPVWNGNKFKPVLMLPLALSYDHRVIDGADGARFITWIKEFIENPFSLLM